MELGSFENYLIGERSITETYNRAPGKHENTHTGMGKFYVPINRDSHL